MTLLCILALGVRLARTGSGRSRTEPGGRDATMRVGTYAAALVAYGLLLEGIGFLASTAVVLTFILKVAEGYRWRPVMLVTTATVTVSHLLFAGWLGVIFPSGALWPHLLGQWID